MIFSAMFGTTALIIADRAARSCSRPCPSCQRLEAHSGSSRYRRLRRCAVPDRMSMIFPNADADDSRTALRAPLRPADGPHAVMIRPDQSGLRDLEAPALAEQIYLRNADVLPQGAWASPCGASWSRRGGIFSTLMPGYQAEQDIRSPGASTFGSVLPIRIAILCSGIADARRPPFQPFVALIDRHTFSMHQSWSRPTTPQPVRSVRKARTT